jgi:hypothetical protein
MPLPVASTEAALTAGHDPSRAGADRAASHYTQKAQTAAVAATAAASVTGHPVRR